MALAQSTRCEAAASQDGRALPLEHLNVYSIEGSFKSISMRFHLKIFRFSFVVGVLLCGLPALLAQTAPDAGLLANPVFKKDCAKCHGKTAEGRHLGGPSLISAKVSAASNEDLIRIIGNGSGRMPKYAGKLMPEEIKTLVEEIKILNKK